MNYFINQFASERIHIFWGVNLWKKQLGLLGRPRTKHEPAAGYTVIISLIIQLN